MKKRIRIQGIIIFIVVITSILFSKVLFTTWKEESLDEFTDAVGVGFVFFGFLFRISARGYKTTKSREGRSLVTDGSYGLTRNPMYFGTLLIGLGIILVLFQLWLSLLFCIIFLLIYIPQINREEERLNKQFGDEYKIYCKRTPKYFPKISSLFKLDLRDYLPLKWPWIKKELVPLVLVIGSILALETWEDARMFGYEEYSKELLELGLVILFFIAIFRLSHAKDF